MANYITKGVGWSSGKSHFKNGRIIVSQVTEFLNNENLNKIIVRTQKAGASVTARMINDFTSYLFVALAYNNAQRPGAVINMTINEFKKSKAIIDTDGQKYYKVVVQSHKTSTTYGGVSLI